MIFSAAGAIAGEVLAPIHLQRNVQRSADVTV
jgi:hypothetical protein